MSEYVQEMAAIVCVFDSGEITVVSTHRTSHEARDVLSEMYESGEAKEWLGRLILADNGICHAHIDEQKMEELAQL